MFIKKRRKGTCIAAIVIAVAALQACDSSPTRYVGPSSISLMHEYGATLCRAGCSLYGVQLHDVGGYTEFLYHMKAEDGEGDVVRLADGDPLQIRNIDLIGVLRLTNGILCATHSRDDIDYYRAWSFFGENYPEVVCERRHRQFELRSS